MRTIGLALAAVLGAAIALAGVAVMSAGPEPAPPAVTVAEPHGEPAPYRVTTTHAVEIGGATVEYEAIAGETFLRNAAGVPTGSLFSFTYLKTPRDEARPVLFVFNGGPGSASVWLHMGVVGPRRVVLDHEVNPSNVPPFGVADNPHSVLDVTDIVFIDPIGTGFSRVIGEGKTEVYWGVDEDAESVARFIELWLTEYGRWNSPKFLMGESYGSVRAAILPRALMGSPIYNGVMRGITVNGIVLLGTTLKHGLERTPAEEALDAALDLPGFAATAWYHGKARGRHENLEALYAESREFAADVYAPALLAHANGMLAEEERAALLEDLAAWTGLSADDFGEDLIITRREFARTLLRDEGLELGLYDSRYTLPLANSGNDPIADDPAMGRYVPGFIAAFHQMLGNDLEVRLARPYASIMWRDLLQNWNWSRRGVGENQSYAVDIAWAMRRNPDLQVLVASGYYDLVTTAASAAQSLDAAGIPRDRIRLRNFASGHMLYIGDTAAAFAEDVRALIAAATKR